MNNNFQTKLKELGLSIETTNSVSLIDVVDKGNTDVWYIIKHKKRNLAVFASSSAVVQYAMLLSNYAEILAMKERENVSEEGIH